MCAHCCHRQDKHCNKVYCSLSVWRFPTLCFFLIYTFILIKVVTCFVLYPTIAHFRPFWIGQCKTKLTTDSVNVDSAHLQLSAMSIVSIVGTQTGKNTQYSQVSCVTNGNIKALISALVFVKGRVAVAACDSRIDSSSLLNVLHHHNKSITDSSHAAIHPACPFYCFVGACERLFAFNQSAKHY